MTQTIPAWIGGRLAKVEKLRVHREGLRHPAVSVFVTGGGQTLLQRRAEGKYHTPGLWANACCTHPHWGEAAEACAARRLREELGIDMLSLVARGRVEYRASVGAGLTEHEVVSLFTAEAPEGLAISPDPAEVAEVRWLGFDALRAEVAARPQGFTPWLRIYLAEHGAQIFGETA